MTFLQKRISFIFFLILLACPSQKIDATKIIIDNQRAEETLDTSEKQRHKLKVCVSINAGSNFGNRFFIYDAPGPRKRLRCLEVEERIRQLETSSSLQLSFFSQIVGISNDSPKQESSVTLEHASQKKIKVIYTLIKEGNPHIITKFPKDSQPATSADIKEKDSEFRRVLPSFSSILYDPNFIDSALNSVEAPPLLLPEVSADASFIMANLNSHNQSVKDLDPKEPSFLPPTTIMDEGSFSAIKTAIRFQKRFVSSTNPYFLFSQEPPSFVCVPYGNVLSSYAIIKLDENRILSSANVHFARICLPPEQQSSVQGERNKIVHERRSPYARIKL